MVDSYIGRRLADYELVERIGEGGMGAVYRARSASGELVAIKLIKRGMDTEAILRRFQNERRILAAMDHANIARWLDAGTTDEGLPYFVMEYIAGRPLNEYCDAERLTVDGRLRLFQQICSAVECAHKIQVIHRDIKPENILVTPAGEPKLLDFGIAKILDRDLIAASEDVTITLGSVMTPRYASPEQARGGLLTFASDIYSLGVLLYELLTGRSPYRLAEQSAQALVDAIRHQYPELPSAAASHPDSAETASRQRSTTPASLRSSLAGNLDAIVLKALEKDPRRRFSSAAEFSADIGRHLEGRAIRSRRSRLRGPLLSLGVWPRAAIAAVLLLALLSAGALLFRRHAARIAGRPSVAVLGFENLSRQPSTEWMGTALTEMLSTELAAGGRLRTVPGELVSRVKFELALPNAQTFATDTLTRLRRSLSADYVVLGSYLALGDAGAQAVRLDLRLQDTRTGEVVTSVSETRRSSELLPLVARTGALLRDQLGAGEVLSADAGTLRRTLPQSGEAARNYSEGLERLRRFDTLAARDLLRNAVATAPDHALSHAALAAASSLLGYDVEARDEARKALELSSELSREERLSIQGRFFESTRAWDKAVETYGMLRHDFPDNVEYGLQLAAAQTSAGQSGAALETVSSLRVLRSAAEDPRVDLAEAEAALASSNLPLARAAARHAAESGASQGLRILAARARLLECRIFSAMGDPQRALAAAGASQTLYRDAGHRQGIAWAIIEAGGVLTQLGDVAGARARYEESLAVCRTIGDQNCIGTDLDSLGVLRRRQGDLQGALEMHRQAIEIRRAVGDRAGVASALYNVGNVLEVIGDLPHAEAAEAEALDLRRQLADGRGAALTMSRLANIRRRLGALEEARKSNEQALSQLRGIGDRGGAAMALFNLGLVLYDEGNLARSRTVFQEALAIRREQKDKNNTAQVLAALALVSLAEGKTTEAHSQIAESIATREQLGEIVSVAQSKLVLADILLEERHLGTAEDTARDAAGRFRTVHAGASEAEAELALARTQLAQRNPRAAAESIARATMLLNGSKDVLLVLSRNLVLARTEFALGRQQAGTRILERTLASATQLGLPGTQFEARLALAENGTGTAEALSSDARSAGYLRIAQLAGSVSVHRQ